MQNLCFLIKISNVYLINYEFLCRAADTNALLDWTAEALFWDFNKQPSRNHRWTVDGLVGLNITQGVIGWPIGNDLWLKRHNRWLIWVIFSPDRQTGIATYPEGSCFGW